MVCKKNRLLSAFSYLCIVARDWRIQSLSAAGKLVHVSNTSRLDYYNSLLSGFSKSFLKSLPLIQNVATQHGEYWQTMERDDPISSISASFHWFPVKSWRIPISGRQMMPFSDATCVSPLRTRWLLASVPFGIGALMHCPRETLTVLSQRPQKRDGGGA